MTVEVRTTRASFKSRDLPRVVRIAEWLVLDLSSEVVRLTLLDATLTRIGGRVDVARAPTTRAVGATRAGRLDEEVIRPARDGARWKLGHSGVTVAGLGSPFKVPGTVHEVRIGEVFYLEMNDRNWWWGLFYGCQLDVSRARGVEVSLGEVDLTQG